jgi:pimeloyl-ACP methyl ester carboxylesterase
MTDLAPDAVNGKVALPRHASFRNVAVDGARRLHYCDWGNPENPRVVVCAHGRRGSARDFDTLARELSTEYRVLCPDLPGRGDGEWLGVSLEFDFPQSQADLDALLSALDLEKVDWIGASLGGQLGIHLAAMPSARIRRLYLTDVATFPRAISAQEIFFIREFLGEGETARCGIQRSLRAQACSSASTSRSTRMGLVR